MASSSPIARKKEGWLGVVLTALGCALFLTWWFWPGEEEPDSQSQKASPENLLQAAQKARSKENSAALDAELAVLAMQAHRFGDDWLVAKIQELIQDTGLRQLVTFYVKPDEQAEPAPPSGTNNLDLALEEDNVETALALGTALEGEERVRAMVKIAAFLTQSGDIDRARALVTQHLDDSSEHSVNLQLSLAMLLAQWGEFEKADVTVKEAASQAMAIDELLQVAKKCYSFNLFDEGLQLMERAEQSASGDGTESKKVLQAYSELGETEKARAYSETIAPTVGDSPVLAVKLAMRSWEPEAFAEGLQAWRALADDAQRAEAIVAVRENLNRQFSAGNVPELFAKPVASGFAFNDAAFAALQKTVDDGQPELAAAAIDQWDAVDQRSLGYVILTRLMLWRHARTSGDAQ